MSNNPVKNLLKLAEKQTKFAPKNEGLFFLDHMRKKRQIFLKDCFLMFFPLNILLKNSEHTQKIDLSWKKNVVKIFKLS